MNTLTFEQQQLLCYVREHSTELRKALVQMILKNHDHIPADPVYHLYLLLEELSEAPE